MRGGWLRMRAWAMALAGALWLALGVAHAQDDPPGRVGRLAALQGEVWVYEPDAGEWTQGLLNRPFTGRESIATGPSASVELRIGSTTLLLGADSELLALRLDDQRMQFELRRGRLALLLRSPEVAAETELLQPEARLQPRQAGLYRFDRADQAGAAIEAQVLRGELRVEGHGMAMSLRGGQRAAFWRDGNLGDTRSEWLQPPYDDFAQAVQQLDLTDPRPAYGYVPPEMTGIEDLQRYGRWVPHAEYGSVWVPTSVPYGWAPYRYGQWVYQAPWGWTWVDDMPWGFAPFHYGRWSWWDSRWVWAPGPLPPRPVYAPALVGWYGGPQFSVSVGSRPVPAWGWVPLAPREAYVPGYAVSHGHLNRLNPQLPPGRLPPPAYVNRGVPGAVTVLPTPGFAARQPVGPGAMRGDDLLRGPWPVNAVPGTGAGRPPPPRRDVAPPRVVAPGAPAAAVAPAAPAAPLEPGRPTMRPSPPVRGIPPPTSTPSRGVSPAVPSPAPVPAVTTPSMPPAAAVHAPTTPAATPPSLTPTLPAMPHAPASPRDPAGSAASPRPQPPAAALPNAPTPGTGPFGGRPPPPASPAAPGVRDEVRPAAPVRVPSYPAGSPPPQMAPQAPGQAAVQAPRPSPPQQQPIQVPHAAPPQPVAPVPPPAIAQPPRPPSPPPVPQDAMPRPRPPDDGPNGRPGNDPNERRRTPESRQQGRER